MGDSPNVKDEHATASTEVNRISVKPESKLLKDCGEKKEAAEDVPADFFDEFFNKDFLDGLNVVDAWEDADSTQDGCGEQTEKGNEEESRVGKLTINLKDRSEKTRLDRIEFNKQDKLQHSRVRESSRSRSRERRRRSWSHERRSRSRTRRSRSRDRELYRRDPNKTRRDIQRDKDRCAKDKEAKIISEKLRVCETGLVPPGMEMDVDLNDFHMPQQDRYNARKRHSKSPENIYNKKRNLSGSGSPKNKRRFRSPNNVRRSSPLVSPPRYDRNNKRPSPPCRQRERSSEYRRHDRTKFRSITPPRSSFQFSSHSRSRVSKEATPNRKKTFLEEIDHKLNLRNEEKKLREIQEKINGVPSSSNIMLKYPHPHQQQVPVPVPQIVPAPLAYNTQPVYDSQFYTGVPEMHHVAYPPMPVPHPHEFPPQQQQHMYYQQQHVTNYSNPPIAQTASSAATYSLEHDLKLFNDESITLSNYLNLTTRTDDSKVKYQRNKIAVSQDAIRIQTEKSKPIARFTFKKPLKPSSTIQAELKNQSPLMKLPRVNFYFTSNARQMDEKLNTPINRLLLKLGLKDIQKFYKSPNGIESSSSIRKYPSAATIPTTTNTNVLQKMIQTDPYECEDCALRNSRKYVDVGVQCGNSVSDFECQVTDDHFLNTARSALKNILKNQSFATLTPAQILAQSEPHSSKPEETNKNENYAMRCNNEMMIERRNNHHMNKNYSNPMYSNNNSGRSFGNAGPSSQHTIEREPPRPLMSDNVQPPPQFGQRSNTFPSNYFNPSYMYPQRPNFMGPRSKY